MRDLIDAGIESLIESGESTYVERSIIGHELKDSALPSLRAMATDKDNEPYRALTQALFESNFLTTNERDFNLDQMMGFIYGTKLYEALSAFHTLFEKLVLGGHTSLNRETMFNPSGDNYYCALQFQIKPDKHDLFVIRFTQKHFDCNDHEFRTDIYRKVIVIQRQSPEFAIVLECSLFTGEPLSLYFLRLKEEYTDPDVMSTLIDREFNIDDDDLNKRFCAESNASTVTKIITKLDIQQMFCQPVYYPKTIESILFSLHSGNDSI